MLKIYSTIIGENPEYTATFQPASKRKIALYANCLMVPVILWFINGYLLVCHVLEGGIFSSLLTAIIAALIIFLIERAIIMSNGSKPIFWFRIFLGIIVASLGSISLDEVIFKQDIDNQVATYRKLDIEASAKKVTSENNQRISNQEQIVEAKYFEWQKRLDDANKEMKNLPGGSGKGGKGDIADENIKMASLIEADYKVEKIKLDNLVTDIKNEKEFAKIISAKNFNGNALLMRIRAMFELIAKDRFMLGVYLLFTLFLFCLEFLVVIIKIGSKNSIDEDLEKAREILIRAKTQKTLDRSSILFNPEQFVPAVQNAKEAIHKIPTSIFN